jgi:hypothetical protein
VKNLSGGVILTVDGGGNITPTTEQTVNRGETILTQQAPGGNSTFTGHICARQDDVCKCSTLVNNVSSGNHMEVGGDDYTVKSSVAIDSEFEIYAITSSGPVANATNGIIRVGG